MDKNEQKHLIGHAKLSVAEAMRIIDSNSYGILFLTDYENRLVGCITDGDIRRFLLSGGELTNSIESVINRSPKVANTIEDAKALYHKRNYIVIPIIDENRRIMDFYDGADGETVAREYRHLDIPVVINAGGRGTRLDPFTKVLPKPLIPVGDYPIMEHIIKEYKKYDCNSFHIIVNYKKDLIKAFFADNDNHYNITWCDEKEPLGTGGGLSLLRGSLNSTFFFANCDALMTADYGEIIDFHRKNKNSVTMVCAYKTISIPYGVIEMGVNGVISEMKEKPKMSFLTNTGIYVVEPEVIDCIGDNEAIGFPEVMERAKKKGMKIAAFPISENDWMDMGQLPELEKMRQKLYGE